MVPFKKGFSRTDERGTIQYRHAVPADAVRLAGLYDSVYSGGYPIKECMDPARVRAIIDEGEHIWMVASEGERIIGAAVAKPEGWNESYETCRSVTHKDYGGRNIGTVLYDMVLQSAFHRDDCDIVFGFPRSDTMLKLLEKTNPPVAIVGSDGGMHLVSGVREEHLVCVTYNPHKELGRVEPRPALYSRVPFLEKLMETFDLRAVEGSYPQESIVGSDAQQWFECAHGRVGFNYFGPSRSASIVKVEADDVEGIRRAVWEFINPQSTPPVRINQSELGHVSLYALADKVDLIAKLCEPFEGLASQRFFPVAYIPGWFSKGAKRFDCIALSARFDTQRPVSHGVNSLISMFETEFERLGTGTTQRIYTP